MQAPVDAAHLETCLDGSEVWEVRLPGPLNESQMRRLAQGSNLKFYPDFPRPYFRIEHARLYTLQGILGNSTFRVTFSKHCDVEGWSLLVELLRIPESPRGSKC